MELSILNDIVHPFPEFQKAGLALATIIRQSYIGRNPLTVIDRQRRHAMASHHGATGSGVPFPRDWTSSARGHLIRSEEHTSEIQSLMRISYAVFCLKNKRPIMYT